MDKASLRKQIAEALKQARLSKGMTAYKVAKDGGMSITQVNRVESGSGNYTIDLLAAYLTGIGESSAVDGLKNIL